MSQITPRISIRLQQVLLSPGFLIGLGALLLNDFYLKQTFGNFLTGKLSDFAGLFIFPLFLAAFVPKRKLAVYVGVAISFLIWKAPISDPLITIWNSFALIHIGRTIDYTDYVALLVLPASYAYFRFVTATVKPVNTWRQAGVGFAVILSVFTFTATQLTKDRTIMLEDHFLIRERHADLVARLQLNTDVKNLRARRDDEVFANDPNVEIDRKTYFFDFVLDRPTCDSASTQMSFLIREEESFTVLRGIDIKFECREYESPPNINNLDRSYKDYARTLFQQNILKHLTEVENK